MARLLVATVPLTGHVQPLLPLVTELTHRGHAVTWLSGTKHARAIAATGARFAPMTGDWDDAAPHPALRGRRGVQAQLAAMFTDPMPAQLADLERIADAPDAIVSDAAHLGAGLYAERHAIPWIGVGISALMCPSADTAPFGSAQPPARASRFLNWLVFRVMFASTNRRYRRARVAAGFAPGTGTYFDAMSRDLFLQPTVPSFEYPRRDLPASVRFIGPLVPDAPRPLPMWWRDVETRTRPIVLVTQGTLATDPRELVEPTLRALAGEDVLVVATTPTTLAAPANARIAREMAGYDAPRLGAALIEAHLGRAEVKRAG